MSPLVNGAAFILDAPEQVPAVWGDEHGSVLWSVGEPLLLCGPPGVGKSTLIQQVVRARIGLSRDPDVLGYTVAPDERRLLYIAADRPAQIARSMRRLFTEDDREQLAARLEVWRGSLPWNVLDDPGRLAREAAKIGVGTVIIDSLKDIASPLSSDEVGSAVKQTLGALTEAGIEVCALHHQRKANGDNRRPIKLDDVYGSAWITAGAGSVLLLHGEAGDAVVEMRHLKQPGEEVGPLTVIHDHEKGTSRVEQELDLYGLLAARGQLTVPDAAAALHGPSPDRNQREKTRRKLEQLVKRGVAHKVDNGPPPNPPIYTHGSEATVHPRAFDRALGTDDARDARNPDESDARPMHAMHAPGQGGPNPLKGGRPPAIVHPPCNALVADMHDDEEAAA